MNANKTERYTFMDSAIEAMLRDLIDNNELGYTCTNVIKALKNLTDIVTDDNNGWLYVDTEGNIKINDDENISGEYRIAYHLFENWYEDFSLVKYVNLTKTIEAEYCETSDRTFLVEVIKVGDKIISEEVIGFYSGKPDVEETEDCSKCRSIRIVY